MKKAILTFLLVGLLSTFGFADVAINGTSNINGFVSIYGSNTKYTIKTGQTTVYQTGDDGNYQKGDPTIPRFTDNLDGTVTDNITGLMWVKQPELIMPGASVIASNQIQAAKGNWVTSTAYVIADLVYDSVGTKYYVCLVDHTSGTFATDLAAGKWRETIWTGSAANLTTPVLVTWTNAVTNCEALTYAGYSDWRLPNLRELNSIVDYGTTWPAISETYFPNTNQDDYYWTSTTYAGDSSIAWIVSFYNGGVDYYNKGSSRYVRPVRSSQ